MLESSFNIDINTDNTNIMDQKKKFGLKNVWVQKEFLSPKMFCKAKFRVQTNKL